MDKKELLRLHFMYQDIAMELVADFKKLNKEQMQGEMKLLAPKNSDLFFIKSGGVENDEVNYQIEKSGLKDDDEYKTKMNEWTEELKKKTA